MEAEEIRILFQSLVGLKCWQCDAGPGTGSRVSLDFGEKVRINPQSKKRRIAEKRAFFSAEYGLFIQDCEWRLEDEKKVICCSLSDNDFEGVMVNGLKKIIQKKIVSINLIEPSFDVSIDFEGGMKLYIFCYTNAIEEIDNYTFFCRNLSISINSDRGILTEPRYYDVN